MAENIFKLHFRQKMYLEYIKKKNLKTQLTKRQKIQLENEQKTQRDKKDIQIAKKHFERCSTSLAVREIS